MKKGIFFNLVSITTVLAIGTGCASLTPTENAVVVGSAAGATAGLIGSAAGLSNSQAAALGLGVGAAAGAATYIIAKRQATERQRQVALARGRAKYAEMSSEKKSKKQKFYVKAPRDENSKGVASAMTYDPKTDTVSKDVVDLKATPKVGAKLEGTSLEYLGS